VAETSSRKGDPQRFGRYVLLDRMGLGGMAEVFRAIMPGAGGFQRTFVVKRILAERAAAPDFVEMFIREARICALLQHPNIVQVFDFGHVDGSYFLAMELLRGRDLAMMLRSLRERKRHFPVAVAAFIAHQVAQGLAYAHALTTPDGQPLDIVHRDVSPSNIMCLRTGGVKLLDFGIAKAVTDAESDHTEQGVFKGKLSYMAPERLRGEDHDGRVDLFALGAVLWELLVGRRLFYGKTELERIRAVTELVVPPPSKLRPEVPASLDAVVMKALERDPEKRYRTGAEMADALEPVLQETKHNSRMLPLLLADLFNAKLTASQVSLTTIPPELLAAMADDPTTSSIDPEPLTGSVPDPGPATTAVTKRRRPRTLGLVVGATAVGLLGISLAAVLMLGFAGSQAIPHQAAEPQPPPLSPATAAATVPARTPTARPVPSGITSEPVVTVVEPIPGGIAGAEARGAGLRPSRPRRSGTTAAAGDDVTGIERDRVARNRVIDPFADTSGARP
jgi:eukaryotic-like serine/threonine-protein kinase